jgi:hypothetical protein
MPGLVTTSFRAWASHKRFVIIFRTLGDHRRGNKPKMELARSVQKYGAAKAVASTRVRRASGEPLAVRSAWRIGAANTAMS